MKGWIGTFLGAAALVSTAALGGQAAMPTSSAAIPAPTLADPLPHVEALFDSYVDNDKMPGIVGAFGVGDLPPVFVSAGHISDDPGAPAAGPDTLWRVYSMTKPVTAMAAMLLIQDGKLKLDEPISDFIPAFKHMTVLTDPEHSLAARPARREITVRNLLTHTAGLGYTIITTGPLQKAYEQAGIVPFAANAQVEQTMRTVRPKTLAAFADKVATLPLIADPGTKWSYSIGLDVLARVVEAASGMPFDRFVQTRLLDPLGMESTYWQVPTSEDGRLATNYVFVGDKRTPLDPAASSVFLEAPSFPYGGAGLVMSARDYDRFAHMIQDNGTLNGVQVMKPETIALATSNLLPVGVTYSGIGGTTGGTQATHPMGFGAGGSVTLSDDPSGAGKGTYAWGGAAGTIFWVDRERHARGTVMVNYMPADKWPVRDETIRALLTDYAFWKQERQ
ncbi:serine hydrolase domain-containing protein [Hephaestia mangrovi]|uniref:serine hydrolase domain-containing protein n=1 Tax=Hephaestia mangrovi TaxID=2873268 RepID=UPI001CA7534A|nr:serine hydrolase domain-containing protein [Hephaestia mangrovi]MBY8826711.1 beta-lactamase family protein [Hephaestia mangrovi]